MSDLHVVFLQGMPSAFFSRIAGKLAALGCKTTGINFCAGDALFWRGQNTVNYRGKLSDWPKFLAELCMQKKVTDIVGEIANIKNASPSAPDDGAGESALMHAPSQKLTDSLNNGVWLEPRFTEFGRSISGNF